MFIKKIIKNIIPYGIVNILNKKPVENNDDFLRHFNNVKNEIADDRFVVLEKDIYPCLSEATQTTSFDGHYIYHPAWAARLIYKNKPLKHIDISSSLHFVSMVSTFVPFEFYDFRPAPLTLSGLVCGKADLTKLFFEDNSIESLSCMHVVEHIGLGRYGDQIDGRGDLKAINELKRVVKPGGFLYFVVPVGEVSRIQFNAHRVYSYDSIVQQFDGFTLEYFSFVNDNNEYVEYATRENCHKQKYGCGCFAWKKN